MIRLITAVILFFSAQLTKAAENTEGFYGPEFTFTHDGDVPSRVKEKYINNLTYHLTKFQPPAARFTIEYESREPVFVSPNGWSFKVSSDPGVIEITMKKMSAALYRRFKDDIQDAIFATAANSELYVWDYQGGGHINMDTRIFGGRLLLARNFVVDFWNNNFLAMGIMNYDINNAVPLALYKPDEIKRIREVIAECDTGKYGDNDQGIARFFNDLNQVQVSGHNYFFPIGRDKNHDLNFAHPGRIEIRSVRPQKNMDVWVNQIELIEGRIQRHLATVTEPIPLNFAVGVQFPLDTSDLASSDRYNPPINAIRAIKSFYRYVSESGLDWKDHREYIWPAWKETALKKFECEKGLEF